MKKTRKLAALFLALILTLSAMAMPAMAYRHDEVGHEACACDEEGIIPRIPAGKCPVCNKDMVYETGDGGGRLCCPDGHVCTPWRPV